MQFGSPLRRGLYSAEVLFWRSRKVRLLCKYLRKAVLYNQSNIIPCYWIYLTSSKVTSVSWCLFLAILHHRPAEVRIPVESHLVPPRIETTCNMTTLKYGHHGPQIWSPRNETTLKWLGTQEWDHWKIWPGTQKGDHLIYDCPRMRPLKNKITLRQDHTKIRPMWTNTTQKKAYLY